MAHFHHTENFIWSTRDDDVLGKGVTADVYKARKKQTGEVVAVKVFNNRSYQRPSEVQDREFEVPKKLHHDNIVKVLGEEGEIGSMNKALLMEYCNDGSLHTVLEQPQNANGLADDDFISVLHDLTAGMYYLHQQGVVHRDIKPGNIMRCKRPNGTLIYKLTDFGTARELSIDEQFQSIHGTEEYLHPDMYERGVLNVNKGKVFASSVDLWSTGVTLYHTATGTLPFRPYGGGRQKANQPVMYKITSEKESGVISGVQNADGSITWSKDLKNCNITKHLCKFVTPILAGLMECDQSRMWTFSKFYSEVQNLINRTRTFLFNVSESRVDTLYLEEACTWAQFQTLIESELGVIVDQQLMLSESHGILKPTMLNIPVTTMESPIYLFTKTVNLEETTAIKFCKIPVLPKFDFNDPLNIDADYRLSKILASVSFSIRDRIQESYRNQQLLRKGITLLVQNTTTSLQYAATQKDLGIIAQSISVQLQLFKDEQNQLNHILNLYQANWDIENATTFKEHQSKSQDVIRNKYKSFSTVNDEVAIVVKMLETIPDTREGKLWDLNYLALHGCSNDEDCSQHAEYLTTEISMLHKALRKRRLARCLLYKPEDQFQRVDKVLMGDLSVRMMELLRDHCQPNTKQLHEVANKVISECLYYLNLVEMIAAQAVSVSAALDTYKDSLQLAQKEYKVSLAKVMSKLEETMASKEDPSRNRKQIAKELQKAVLDVRKMAQDASKTSEILERLNVSDMQLHGDGDNRHTDIQIKGGSTDGQSH